MDRTYNKYTTTYKNIFLHTNKHYATQNKQTLNSKNSNKCFLFHVSFPHKIHTVMFKKTQIQRLMSCMPCETSISCLMWRGSIRFVTCMSLSWMAEVKRCILVSYTVINLKIIAKPSTTFIMGRLSIHYGTLAAYGIAIPVT